MRVGIMKSRPSEWFAKTRRLSADFFVEDIKVRDFLEKKLARSGVAKVVIRKTLKLFFSHQRLVLLWEKMVKRLRLWKRN